MAVYTHSGATAFDILSPLPSTCPAHGEQRLPDACARCLVRSHAICGALEDAELADLESIAHHQVVEAGKMIAFEGDSDDFAYNIISGGVKLWKSLPDGRTQIVGVLLPGDFLGLFRYRARNTTAETIERTQLCAFPGRKFEAIAGKYRNLEERIRSRTMDEITAAQDHMLLLGRKTADERVATFLITLAERLERIDRSTDPLILPLGRGDLAGHLGLSLETVSRVFSRLKSRGLIELAQSDHVILRDRATLEDMAEGE